MSPRILLHILLNHNLSRCVPLCPETSGKPRGNLGKKNTKGYFIGNQLITKKLCDFCGSNFNFV